MYKIVSLNVRQLDSSREKRQVRWGCPLSGLLVVIGIELLNQSIRRWNKILGIIIQPQKEEIKPAQYADETTVFLADTQSVSDLFDLLSVFEKCSGFKINHGKSELSRHYAAKKE